MATEKELEENRKEGYKTVSRSKQGVVVVVGMPGFWYKQTNTSENRS